MAYESGLADVVDPLGGSYYVEAMTNAIYDEAMAYGQEIDREMGGAVVAIEKGYIKKFKNPAYKWQMGLNLACAQSLA